MASALQATLALRYVAPGNATVNSASVINASYDAVESGTTDIPNTTPSATVYDLAFGGVAEALAFFLQNNSDQDLGVRFNNAVADEFQLAPGAAILMAMPVAANANPLTAISVVTTATEATDNNSFDYLIFG